MEEKILEQINVLGKSIEGLSKQLNAFEIQTNKKFDGIDERFNDIDKKFDGIDKKFGGIDKKFGGIDKRFKDLTGQLNAFEKRTDKRFDDVDDKIETLGIQVKENTDMLKALRHSAEVNKAEHDKMMVDMAHVQGDVKAIRKDLSNVEILTANNYADIAKLKAVR